MFGGTAKSCAITQSHYTIEANLHHSVESIKIFKNFNQIVGGEVDLTMGTVFDSAKDPDNNTNIWAVLDNITGQTINWFYTSSALDGSYPTNWSSTTWHAGDNITR